MTEQEQIKILKQALEEIAWYDVKYQHGCIDEWEEAEAFGICQQTAQEALNKVKE